MLELGFQMLRTLMPDRPMHLFLTPACCGSDINGMN